MSLYRFCMLDPSGQIRDYWVRACPTLEDAHNKAEQLLADWPRVEIWESARRVACLMPSSKRGELLQAA